MQRGKFQFSTLLAAILDFSTNSKSVNISKTIRDRAISSEFLTHRILQEYTMQWRKFSIFATFGGHLGFLRKTKKCEYLENHKRYSDFERIFDPQASTRVFYAKGKNFKFCHFWRPSWILVGK